MYAPSGHLLFVRQDNLFAQGFDLASLSLHGNPFLVSERVPVDGPTSIAAVATSSNGLLVYRSGSTAGLQAQFEWVDRSGTSVGKVGGPDNVGPSSPMMSPDGRRLAFFRTLIANADIWVLEIARGVLTRLTFDAAVDAQPVWSPDGSRIVFSSARNGSLDLFVKSATGAGTEDVLLASPNLKAASDWSPDGRHLLYRNNDAKTGYDLWALPMDGKGKPFPVVRTPFEERDGQFSPDGKWIAYQSTESGHFEVYVQPFPGPGGKWQISTNGGAQVRWRRDGREIYYIALDGKLMAVPIQLASNAAEIEPGTPAALFDTHVGGAVQMPARQQYAVSPDGQRFLMNTVSEEANTSPITVVLNWKGAP